MRGAFACTRRVDGKSVAVVDDVMTTGATLAEVATTLKLPAPYAWSTGSSPVRCRRMLGYRSRRTRDPAESGNVIRLAANTGARLHFVEPLGFHARGPAVEARRPRLP